MATADDAAAAPLFIRLAVRRPCACLLLWMAVPITLTAFLVPVLELSPPLVGWRMKNHVTAEAVDMLVLAIGTVGTLPDNVRRNLTAGLSPATRRQLDADAASSHSAGGKRLHVNAIPMRWGEAKGYCELFGGRLATVESAEENHAVLLALRNDDFLDGEFAWLGGSDLEVEGTWKWTDGRSFSQGGNALGHAYTNWNYGEPNDYQGGEDCLQIRLENGKWNDNSCDRALLGSVCAGGDFPPPPPSVSVPLQSRTQVTAVPRQ